MITFRYRIIKVCNTPAKSHNQSLERRFFFHMKDASDK